jgi:hypothetical protein
VIAGECYLVIRDDTGRFIVVNDRCSGESPARLTVYAARLLNRGKAWECNGIPSSALKLELERRAP